MSSYCTAIRNIKPGDRELHQVYHDRYYGFPIKTDDELFCRLVLEINQAGLSWTTILKKEAAFRKAFHQFRIEAVANYGTRDRERLLADASIIRNRLKIDATIENARTLLLLRGTHGSFGNWLDAHHPQNLEQWVHLFRKTFRFTGGEIVREFLVSSGYLPGAHHHSCPTYREVLQTNPPWALKK